MDTSMKISRNTVVTVNFVVTDPTGKVVGRTDPKSPIEALLGHGSLVPGLEQALDGHEKGDSFTTTLNPALAYGEMDESLIQTIDRRMFGDFPLEVGNVFEADTSRGRVGVVVKEIRDNEVVVDGNHPLAGQTLTFLVTVEDVREAISTHRLILNATPGTIPGHDMMQGVIVSSPGVPYSFDEEARRRAKAIIHDPLEIGAAVMLTVAVSDTVRRTGRANIPAHAPIHAQEAAGHRGVEV